MRWMKLIIECMAIAIDEVRCIYLHIAGSTSNSLNYLVHLSGLIFTFCPSSLHDVLFSSILFNLKSR